MSPNINTAGASIEKARKDHDDVRNRSLSIKLPHQKEIYHISVDIGGSLAKCVYFHNGGLHFASYETENLHSTLSLLKKLTDGQESAHIMATGGGAIKYHDEICETTGLEPYEVDEIESLIKGATFFISEIPNEVFSWDPESSDSMIFAHTNRASHTLYPYLLVNIGSGVGFIKVEGPNKFERIGGSALGGGTLWGLLAMLTPAQNFDEMLHMAARGDNTNVDMLVGDIYGAGYPKMGLSASTTASFFAKAFKDKGNREFNPCDISRSLLIAISYNIAQLAYMHARYHGIEEIYFAGSYIRGHRQTIETMSQGINYWSKGDKTAYFFRHEGYLGAMGAFLSDCA